MLATDTTDAAADGCALVLMGGGARTAYQAGVLKALAAMLGTREQKAASHFPFRWLFGTSAGALNAAYLGSHAGLGLAALPQLADFWRGLRSEQVYRLDAPGWVHANRLVAGWTLARQVRRHRALLDTLPLVDTLHRAIDLKALEQALEQHHIDVLGVSASSYTSGEHWIFCQTRSDSPVQPWHRPGRRADFQPITIEHLMASSAIPFLFPAVPLWVDGHKEHFGDGSMRQLSPLSPAIHFGARRVLVIGVGQPQRSGMAARVSDEPTAGTIAGHAMASVFHDTLQSDVEQTQRVSQTLARLPPHLAAALPYRPIEVLALQPSFSLDELAHKYIGALPRPTRNTLVGLGALDTGRAAAGSAASLASYLLFEPDFVSALMELGEGDAKRRQDELMRFMAPSPSHKSGLAVP
ncbi:MAG: patatin-like phospholipase family protein [Hydrogenophaga sp.]|uniref:patatin-like phospholipase family protein n=1 Tax=Hydrogenophaga sp. TaxID=1904254 RepID=UPI00275FD5B9|nr:patatin-like phospholipase family protein [Hydrogenophaga sp.]MDP2418071.1 patatin-like phospholipase family protein [Hydrogenophaga sp.]MDZ4188989.1 patatin-like phospholipase family protein [Hydrogenophaga sp.]